MKREDCPIEEYASIKIGGHEIEKYEAQALRKKFLILREDPLVFTGSVRDNVDPFNLSTDEEIVKVLHYLGLYTAYSDFIKSKQTGRIERHIDALSKKKPV